MSSELFLVTLRSIAPAALLLLIVSTHAHTAESSTKCKFFTLASYKRSSNAIWLLHMLYICSTHAGPNITLSKSSSTAPVVANGTNYTLYREFVTEGDIQELNVDWKRDPFPLDPYNGTYRIEKSQIDIKTLRASLVLWDIQVVPDNGDYTVTASNNCGSSNKTVFYLHVDVSCPVYETPQPLILSNSSVLAEPDLTNILLLTVTFHGPSDNSFLTIWSSGDSVICLEDSEFTHPGFRCDRSLLGPCWFVANLWLLDPTYASSREYSVYATDTGNVIRGNSSTIDLGESQNCVHISHAFLCMCPFTVRYCEAATSAILPD